MLAPVSWLFVMMTLGHCSMVGLGHLALLGVTRRPRVLFFSTQFKQLGKATALSSALRFATPWTMRISDHCVPRPSEALEPRERK